MHYVDCETDGLYGPVTLVQIYSKEDGLELFRPEIDAPLRYIIEKIKSKKIIGHNIYYDFTCLGIDPAEVEHEDTYLLSKLHFIGLKSYSLDSVMTKVYGFDPYEKAGLDKKKMQKLDWSGKLSDEQIKYASLDVTELPEVYTAVKSKLTDTNYIIDKLTMTHFVQAKSGMPVLRDKMEQRLVENKEKITEEKLSVNANSYQQVRAYLQYDESDDEALAYLTVEGDEHQKTKAAKVRRVRKLKKQNSFITKYLSLSEHDGYVYGHLGVATVSGRSNCSNENLQQIPGALKDCFGSNDKYLVYADFSNLELRTFCAVVGERTMEKLLREEVDLHTYTASRLFNKEMSDVEKVERQIAKIFNFSSLYGAGVERRRLILLKMTGIYLKQAEAAKYARAWLMAFPQVKGWQDANAHAWRSGIPGSTILGRQYIAKLFTDQNNVQISGTAAEIAKLALHYMTKRLNIRDMNIFVHDSYTFEYDSLDDAKAAAKIIGESMQEAWFEVTKLSKITDLPMPVEVIVGHKGQNWYEIQEGINPIHKEVFE